MARLNAILLVVCLSAAARVIGANDTEDRIRRVTQEIPPPVVMRGESPMTTTLAGRMADLHVPGVSIAVIHQSRIEWARGFGVTRAGGPAITDTTLFQAASVSKPVFALAVLRLVDAGKLNLQTNVNAYHPQSESAIRKLIAGLSAGNPDYDSMNPGLAEQTRQQLIGLQRWFEYLGAIQSVEFRRVNETGTDEFRATFEKGALKVFIRLNEDGRIEAADLAPA